VIINPYIFGVASTLNTGLYAVYNADNSPNDSFGSNNGTLINGATYATGKINQAFSFDGVNDYLSLPNNSLNLGSSAAYSFSCWVNYTGFGQYVIYSNNNNGFSTAILLSIQSEKIVIFHLNAGGQDFFTQQTTLTQSSLQNITVTISALGELRVYVNAVAITLNGYLGGTNYTRNFTVFPIWSGTFFSTIGADIYLGSPERSINGLIDMPTFWTKVLTPSEVTELYNGGNGKQYPY